MSPYVEGAAMQVAMRALTEAITTGGGGGGAEGTTTLHYDEVRSWYLMGTWHDGMALPIDLLAGSGRARNYPSE